MNAKKKTMIRVPSLIHAGEFQSLKIQDMTFVAYRNQDPPLKNEVFFEEHAVIFVLAASPVPDTV